MLDSFQEFVRKELLFEKKHRLLLAVSGGVDSVVLTQLCHQTGMNFAIAHCNFGLRGTDSDQDEQFVEALANHYQVPFFSTRFDTEKYAREHRASIQMAARDLRYEWLETIRTSQDYDWVVVGSQRSDDLETMLLNFTRGTGISGIRGMLPKRNKVVRPLLFASKEVIRQYATEQQLDFREDQSNTSAKYHRNKLRLEVIPLLKAINPAIEETATANANRLKKMEIIYHQAIETERQRVFETTSNGDIHIPLEKLRPLHPLKTYLHEWLRPFGFNASSILSIADSLETASGKKFISPSHILYKDREQLILVAQKAEAETTALVTVTTDHIEAPLVLHFKSENREQLEWIQASHVAMLDFDRLQFPLQIRPWRAGDSFVPFGMQNQKKVSDLLIDAKVPVPEKKRVFVLTSGDDIVWVIGHRIDNRFRIAEATKKVYIATVSKG